MDYELLDQLIHNATQPLYDKITEMEKALSSLAIIATEYSESYPLDYQTLSNYLNKKG